MNERLRIAVCDDESRAAAIVSASVGSVFQDMGIDISLETFLGAGQLLERIGTKAFDLIFLDISMPKMDGVMLGKAIQESGNAGSIVFVSSRTDRMFDTFAVQPFGFVRKNRFMDDLNEVITRFVEKREKGAQGHVVCLKDGQGTVSINIDCVKYIECVRNTQILHFEDGKTAYKVYSRMETLEQELRKYSFIRIHKGYLASCKFIRRIDARSALLTTGEELPVGRSHYRQVMDEYLAYISSTGAPYIGGDKQI